MIRVGVDIGGTGIKSALVDTDTGDLRSDRLRTLTPEAPTPEAVSEVVAEQLGRLGGEGTVGVGLPAVVQHGTVRTAAHLHADWVGVDAAAAFRERLGRDTVVLNDADMAGIAETRLGAGRDTAGVILMLTLGTGIGSAIFVDGTLVPNLELGHIEVHGEEGEDRAAASVRKREDLSWDEWAERLNEYLDHVERLVWPDVIILGGGVTKKTDRFLERLEARAEIRVATLRNNAGIVGAALMAADLDR